MKKLFYTLFVLCFTGILNDHWFQIPSGTYENLNDIQFVDANTCYAVGNLGVVLKTTNNGQNWVLVNTGQTFNNYCINIYNNNTIYIGTENHKYLKSTDSGISWALIEMISSFNYPVKTIYFLNDLLGYSCHADYLDRTTNGGLNWNTVVYYFIGNQIYFIPGTTRGWVCGHGYYDIYTRYNIKYTTNGYAWTDVKVNQNNSNLTSVHFISSSIGYTVSDSGYVFKSTNGGANWTQKNTNNNNKLNSIVSTTLNDTWAAGDNGTILRTSNAGISWVQQNSTTLQNLNRLFFIQNSNTGWISGNQGTLLKTTNGGVSVRRIEELIPKEFALYQNYPNPFNSSTTIRYSIPKNNLIKINIYDINGKIISKLFENRLSPGIYEVKIDASNWSSGIYIIKLESGNNILTKKISLIK